MLIQLPFGIAASGSWAGAVVLITFYSSPQQCLSGGLPKSRFWTASIIWSGTGRTQQSEKRRPGNEEG